MQYEDIIALLPDYLAGQLSKQQQQIVSRALADSAELRAALADIEALSQMRTQWQDETPPEWHRTAFLARRQKSPGLWLNWLSMATSVAAICLVLFRVEIMTNSDGVHIGFAEPSTKVAFKQQADEYLREWQQAQDAYLSQQLVSFENQQLRRDQRLVSTVLDLNKEQRRRDLLQLTTFLAQQRNQDLLTTQDQVEALYEYQDQDRKDIQQLYASLDSASD